MRAIVDQVAALTEAAQVAQAVVGRIMIQVRGGEHDARRPQPHDLFQVGPAGDTAAPVAPRLSYRKYSTDYLQAESAAKHAGAGIWRGEFTPPWGWRAARR